MTIPTANFRSIPTDELYGRWRRGEPVELIDIREPVDFAEAHVPMARWVPYDRLVPHQVIETRRGAVQETLYIICQIGKRSREACQRFMTAGFEQVVHVEGGTEAWRQAGLPVEGEKGVVGIRRQVQIIAGGLVLTGAVLGMLVHPWFTGVAAAVGAGLMFAGITDTCAMGTVLARMPWNRRVFDSSSATEHAVDHTPAGAQSQCTIPPRKGGR